MADKKISDLTATTSLAGGDLFELENVGNNSRKITATNAAKELQTLGFSGAKVKKASTLAAQNLTGFVATTFDSEVWDTDNYHSTVSNTDRLTPPAAGYYQCQCAVTLDNVTTGNWARVVLSRYDSGGSYLEDISAQQIEISATGTIQLSSSGETHFASGDYAKMNLQVEADTSVDVSNNCWFSIRRLGLG